MVKNKSSSSTKLAARGFFCSGSWGSSSSSTGGTSFCFPEAFVDFVAFVGFVALVDFVVEGLEAFFLHRDRVDGDLEREYITHPPRPPQNIGLAAQP